jgi:hypothetical protein
MSFFFNYAPPDDKERALMHCAATNVLLAARTVPAIAALGAVGKMVVVAFPDAATMRRVMCEMMACHAGDGWRRYTVCFDSWFSTLEMPGRSFAVGYYEDAPPYAFRGVFMAVSEKSWAASAAARKKDRAAYAATLMDMMRSLTCFDLPEAPMTGREVMKHLLSACSACGAPEATPCAGCGLVSFCSGAPCKAARAARNAHPRSRCTGAAYVRRALQLSSDPADTMCWKKASEKHMAVCNAGGCGNGGVVVPLAFSACGAFNDERRSRLVWDVTRPPTEARLLPGCMSPFEAWRCGFGGVPVTAAHLAAELPGPVHGVSLPSYFGRALVHVGGRAPQIPKDPQIPPLGDQSSELKGCKGCEGCEGCQGCCGGASGGASGGGNTMLGELMHAVYAAMRGPPPGWIKRQPSASNLRTLADMDTDHRRLDHLQPTDTPGRWRLQLGGTRIMHEGVPSTGFRLSSVVMLMQPVRDIAMPFALPGV